MSESKMGAVVIYCGHDASFVADIHRIGDVNVVIAHGTGSEAGFNSHLTRPADPEATHHLVDFPGPVYWSAARGVFAVPEGNVKALKPNLQGRKRR
jgi:hypothetical protein